MQAIQTVELASAQAAIEFTSIPNTFNHLIVLLSTNSVSNNNNLRISFNGSFASYTSRNLVGIGNNRFTQTSSYGQLNSTTNATANTFNSVRVTIFNYAALQTKRWLVEGVSEANATGAYQHTISGSWADNYPITSIRIDTNEGNNLVQYSSATLYGITTAS